MSLHVTRLLVLAALALLVWALGAYAAAVPPRKPPSPDEIAKAKKIIEADEKLTKAAAKIEQIGDGVVAATLPDHVLFSVMFRRFPVARVPPEGLAASNVAVVARDGKVTFLTNTKGLEKFFRTHATAATDDNSLGAAAYTWSRLAQDLHQDGFYRFQLLDPAKQPAKPGGPRTITTVALVMQGGSGTMRYTLTFDTSGKLSGVVEDVKLRPGPRPICQATKLLDPDPVVRKMAEQDLLIMGRPARRYLDEQRAKASPALRRAIDRLWRRIEQGDPE
jgi:hypothetical protein